MNSVYAIYIMMHCDIYASGLYSSSEKSSWENEGLGSQITFNRAAI